MAVPLLPSESFFFRLSFVHKLPKVCIRDIRTEARYEDEAQYLPKHWFTNWRFWYIVYCMSYRRLPKKIFFLSNHLVCKLPNISVISGRRLGKRRKKTQYLPTLIHFFFPNIPYINMLPNLYILHILVVARWENDAHTFLKIWFFFFPGSKINYKLS